MRYVRQEYDAPRYPHVDVADNWTKWAMGTPVIRRLRSRQRHTYIEIHFTLRGLNSSGTVVLLL